MSKYKVGDRVVVIFKEKMKDSMETWPMLRSDMEPYFGRTVTIKEVDDDGTYRLEECDGWWCNEFFEGLEEDIMKKTKDLIYDSIAFDPKKLDTYIALTNASQYRGNYLSKLEDSLNALVKHYTSCYPSYKLKNTLKGANNTMNKKDILAVRNYNDRAMVVQFNKKDKNGKNIQTRAEVHDGDTFDLDEGIRICLLKYLLGGHKEYMAIMNAARKSYKKTKKEDQKKATEKYKKAIAPAANEDKKKEKRDKEIEELITKAIKKALAETAESYDKAAEE